MRPTPDQVLNWVSTHFDYKTRKDGAELVICNPFDGDTGYHFNISVDNGGACHDWRSDQWASSPSGEMGKRSFLRFVQLFKGCSYVEAVREVCGVAVNPRTHLAARNRQTAAEPAPGLSVALPVGTERLSDPGQPKLKAIVKNWILSRGITEAQIEKYDIRHAGLEVVFPYYEWSELVYWQTRSISAKVFRFPDASIGVTKGQFLYGFDFVEPASHLVILESIIDAILIGEQCVAIGGAALASDQIKKIGLLGPRKGIILAADNDIAGVESVLENGRLLTNAGFKVFHSIPPAVKYGDKTVKDWGEYAQHVCGIDNIKRALEDHVEPLTSVEHYRLAGLVAKAKRS